MTKANVKIFDEELYEGDIKESCNIRFTKDKVIVAGNIDAWNIVARDINALNINAWDINALDINALNINAWDIDARDIDTRDIDALNIDARNIDAWDILCTSRTGKGKTFCRFFAIRDHKAERKEWEV